MLVCGAARADDDAYGLGALYAQLSLMAVSPDVAAANYTIDDDGSDIDVHIGRFPLRFDLDASAGSTLQLELMPAYQRTEEVIDDVLPDGGSIDSRWNTYGASIGLIHEKYLGSGFYFTSNLRLGITETRNRATYGQSTSDEVEGLLDGKLLNWRLRTAMAELGLGAGYRRERLGRTGSIESVVSRGLAESFDESDDGIDFSESVNVLSTLVDVVSPTRAALFGERLDLVVLGGHHLSFGENARTLGYRNSFRAGIGVERPVSLGSRFRRYVRVSGQVLWADGMRGWLLSVALGHDRPRPSDRTAGYRHAGDRTGDPSSAP